MPQITKKYIAIAVTVLIVVIGLFIFTQEPFRNDTTRYITIKREAWIEVQKPGNSDDKAATFFKNLNTNLGTIKCNKVEDIYKKECDTLKVKVKQGVDMIDSKAKDEGSFGYNLVMDIVNIIRN